MSKKGDAEVDRIRAARIKFGTPQSAYGRDQPHEADKTDDENEAEESP